MRPRSQSKIMRVFVFIIYLLVTLHNDTNLGTCVWILGIRLELRIDKIIVILMVSNDIKLLIFKEDKGIDRGSFKVAPVPELE